MNIERVELACANIEEGGRWYREVLDLPVTQGADDVEVRVGQSVLVLRQGPAPAADRAQHLAFTVPADRIGAARDWLAVRLTLLTENGDSILAGPPGWDSESLYFRGPDDAVLEFIARHDLGNASGVRGPFSSDEIISISEVAFGAADVDDAVLRICSASGLALFVPVREQFVPVGDQHGLLIVTGIDRVLFPTATTRPARTPVSVTVRAPMPGMINPTCGSMLVSVRDEENGSLVGAQIET